MKLYVNGSPKLENGNSNYFLNKIKDKEKIKCVYRDRFSDILKDIKKVDTIILCFPLYVDGPTCKTRLILVIKKFIQLLTVVFGRLNIIELLH